MTVQYTSCTGRAVLEVPSTYSAKQLVDVVASSLSLALSPWTVWALITHSTPIASHCTSMALASKLAPPTPPCQPLHHETHPSYSQRRVRR